MTIDTARKLRWRSSVHEGGHALAMLAYLGGHGEAVVGTEGDGKVEEPDRPTLEPRGMTPDALISAAGPAAEALGLEPTDPEAWTPPPAPTDSPEEARARWLLKLRAAAASGPSDDRAIALWAITGYEGDPDSWCKRVTWLRYQAGLLVADARGLIQGMADELYRTGNIAARTLARPKAEGVIE